MHRLVAPALALALAATPVWAQAPASAPPAPPVSPPTTGTTGANSFTESQAKSRIEAAGYSEVTGLFQDKDGIWRGTATMAGAQVKIGLDFKGTIIAP